MDFLNRCEHCTSHLNLLALCYRCCGQYYACVRCHDVLAGHEIVIRDKADYETQAVLYGVCRAEFGLEDDLAGDDRCPSCKTQFNPEIKASDLPMLLLSWHRCGAAPTLRPNRGGGCA